MKAKKKPDRRDSSKNKKDEESEQFEIEMPDVKDIPGQEHIHVPPAGELADTTISSADEEGPGILDNPDDEDLVSPDSNVSKEERKALSDASKKILSRDQKNLESSQLDQYDEDGNLLNEPTGLSGEGLDVPGSDLDDRDEEIGEEDEENNPYSVDEENEDNDINTRQ